MVAKPKIDPRGLKRICTNCGNRFYDLNKRPIICPSCETEFTGEIKLKARRGRAASNDAVESQVKKSQVEDEEDDDDIIMDDDTLSLDDLDEGKDDDEDEDDIDLDLDDDIGDLDDLEPDADDLDDLDDDIDDDMDEEEDV
jgi:uncharacterized protein (TIGR02300 family)